MLIGPILDWTDNREKDALDEEDRQAHQLCAHDGLDGRCGNIFAGQALTDGRRGLSPLRLLGTAQVHIFVVAQFAAAAAAL